MSDPILDWMRENGYPVTRESYIELNWMGDPPDPWTAEDEAQLPPELQTGGDDEASPDNPLPPDQGRHGDMGGKQAPKEG